MGDSDILISDLVLREDSYYDHFAELAYPLHRKVTFPLIIDSNTPLKRCLDTLRMLRLLEEEFRVASWKKIPIKFENDVLTAEYAR